MFMKNDPSTAYAGPSRILDPNIATGDVIVSDISGSMDDESFEPRKSKRQVMHEAIASYVQAKRTHRPQDYVAIIAYQTSATVCCPLMNVERHGAQILEALHQMEQLRHLHEDGIENGNEPHRG